MKKLIIIKAGSTFAETAEKHGDFDELTWRGLGIEPGRLQVINAFQGETLPNPESCLGVVITGAHSMVTDNLPWSLAIEAWLPSLVEAEVPLLGICYGHQLLGRAMGGHVDFHPRGKEVGTITIRLCPASSNDLLFDELPLQFPVHATHAQSVLTLPHGAVLLAENNFEPHHAFRLGRYAWGVQFHPEYNSNVMRDYIKAQTDTLTRAGQDVSKLLKKLRETPEANNLLARFAQLTTKGENS